MILTCPQCATRYFLDDGRVGPAGRALQCGRCGANWRAEPAPVLPAPLAPEIYAEPEAPEREDAAPEQADLVVQASAFQEPILAEPVVWAPSLQTPVLPAPPEPDAFGGLGSPLAASQHRAAQRGTAKSSRRGRGALAAAVSVLAVLICIVALAVLLEPQVVRQWPGASGFYAAVGLAADTPPPPAPKAGGLNPSAPGVR